jgi:hypothetical protein
LWARLSDVASADGVPEPAELRLAVAMITPEYPRPVKITVSVPPVPRTEPSVFVVIVYPALGSAEV